MRMRKLLCLLMVEICVAICNTAAQEWSRTLVVNGANISGYKSSTEIQKDSEDAEITDSVQDVTEKSTSTMETSTSDENTGTRSKNDFKKKNESTDLKKEKQSSVTKESRTNSNKSDKTTDLDVAKKNATEETKAKVTIDEQMSTNGEKNQSEVGQSTAETNDEGTVEAAVQEIPQEYVQEDIQQPEITNNYLESDYIVIKGNTIPIAYGAATQDMVDTYDVVQDTGLIEDTNNTFLFGHNDLSFSILDTVNCGETITVNNYGVTKNYQVERSELAILTDDETDIIMFSDGNNVVYRDYGFPALVLITCARGYDWNYRWVIVAREMD